MKRRTTLSIALVVSLIFVSLMSSDSTAKPQPQMRFFADTGLIKIGPNQRLRVSVAAGDIDGDGLDFRFRRTDYIEQGSLYRIGSQTTSALIRLDADQAGALDLNDLFIRRVMVMSNRRVRVTATISNVVTGEVTSHIIVANTEGDIH